MFSMSEDYDDESPRKRKKAKGFSRKTTAIFVSLLLFFVLGAAVTHYLVEPIVNESAQNYSACLAQKGVSEQRYLDCAKQLNDTNNLYRACDYQLQQCLGLSISCPTG